MLQPGMEAKRSRRWKMQAAREEICFGQRAVGRHRSLPGGERSFGALGVVAIRLCPLGGAARRKTRESAGVVLGPQTTRPQSCDDLLLITARMAVDQDLAVVCVAD